MLGKNPKLPLEAGNGDQLKVHSMFYTIQGEGPYAGHPAFFIRLSGCNLSCNFCDTEFTDYNIRNVEDILSDVLNTSNVKLVVITGGEPFRQNISVLCDRLIKIGIRVQIETNGTIYKRLNEQVEIVCSPKAVNGMYHRINEKALDQIIAIKFLISAHRKEYSDIAEVGQEGRNIPVYVQPMDEYNKASNAENVNLAIRIAKERGAILSMQMHKILDIP
ncbi:MAG: 7-carboxy-7-deazaguanine synthase QueE [Proteobacteria bacterium]|nr:7-carboxy-7-deazaguanine synthase QueE [Pseudomonadota bacterium]